ncbi:MAG: GIY-YIG nuclease family protein, partial [Candidatus Adiutrix sp.]
MNNFDLDDLRAELDGFSRAKSDDLLPTAREERILAGFSDIEAFYEQHGRPPQPGENNDIFERLLAVRLDKIRRCEECGAALLGLDKYRLIQGGGDGEIIEPSHDFADDEILQELSTLDLGHNDRGTLKHIKPRGGLKAAEEIAQRTLCVDFGDFKPLFVKIQHELKEGLRKTIEF